MVKVHVNDLVVLAALPAIVKAYVLRRRSVHERQQAGLLSGAVRLVPALHCQPPV